MSDSRKNNMNNRLMKRIIKEEMFPDDQIENALTEMCDLEHSPCNENCMIFEKFGEVPRDGGSTCRFAEDGKAMLEELRNG
jgi:hypothetical protein